MRGKFSRQQTIIVILLALLLGGSSLLGLGNADSPIDPAVSRLRYILIGTSLLSFLLMSRRYVGHFPINPPPLVFVWYLFGFTACLSGYANEDLTMMRDGLWFLVGIPLIFFYALPKLMNTSANLIIVLATLLGTLPYIIASFLLNPFWQFQDNLYRGVFANANQLGSSALTMSASVFILLIGAFSARKNKLSHILLLNFILFCSLLVILLANSRTSLIAFFAMFSILINKILRNPKYLGIIFIIATIVIALFLIFSTQNPWLWEQIAQIQNKDSVSGRDYIWNQTLTEMQLLGNGSDYFELNFGLGAHNTIIDILGINGIIAALLMVCFAIASFCYAFLYFKKYAKQDSYAIAPLVITTSFWVLSMGEGMFGSFGTGITIAYLLSIGVIITKSNPGKYQNKY
ncbi:O-antigen ligase family protein [Cylindrospermum sp. FACHB-282]|uniref:O-antigen ligase family protein n=1 Tax=Cylindrospermum sp. FACHB-282 TaxID=2692794 RepID=UPI0016836FF2|nr:O-antigen ligase family protein [Cylindrospermum sp. FACHB-282]MBD2387482.1 O-antigen ligase family protein [Cylindrospermum sp. FACHB-282]